MPNLFVESLLAISRNATAKVASTIKTAITPMISGCLLSFKLGTADVQSSLASDSVTVCSVSLDGFRCSLRLVAAQRKTHYLGLLGCIASRGFAPGLQ